MKRLIIAAALAATTLAGALPAAAQVNMRQDNQAARIEQGVRTGQVTRGEANGLARQQGRIARTESRMRMRNGGSLNRQQRRKLAMRQMRASRHIYRARHNGRAY